ncbi:MAG: hypothetical protein WCS73_05160 [Lentisphaeria bacterium]
MTIELNIYTGQLNYSNVDCLFVFDGKELRLIFPKDKRSKNNMQWISTSPEMNESYLIGKCNENGHTLIFIIKQGDEIGCENSVLLVKIVAYIDCKDDREEIGRITFSSPEINYIHPVNQLYNYSIDEKKGVFSLTTLGNDSTTTKKQTFKVNDANIQVQFGLSKRFSKKIGEIPISLNSVMSFEFDMTKDYAFIMKLWYIAKEFIQFLCYRKNVFLPIAELFAPDEGGKQKKFATLYVLDETGDSEPETSKKGRPIKQEYISGFEGKILRDIADNRLYTRHLPNTFESRKHKDVAQFIMIITAFEWEFRRAYPDGIPKKEATIKVETNATKAIQSLIESSTGKLKKKYKSLKKLIKSDSLSNEIEKIGKDFAEVIGKFGKELYHKNKENLVYSEIGKRLAFQRNHFAHGDLDEEFIGQSLTDLLYIEYVVYVMQLRFYGIDDINIERSTNELFF